MSGIDEQTKIPNCTFCKELPHNWYIKTADGIIRSAGLSAWIFPEERLVKEALNNISQIKKPIMMAPVPRTKEDLVCALDDIVELLCTTCHKHQQSDVILVERIKRILIRAYEKAGDETFLKLKV